MSGVGASDPAPPPAADGFHHPASEQDLVELVKAANREGRQLRVRGAAHSPGDAIYTDPAGTATLETSLLWQLATEKGWSLEDTGGITHQTVSGFTATGSSGGSLQYSANRNLWAFASSTAAARCTR
jgi:FAD/FMN-containing dehydrogenase